jgi:hypothetical protein
MNILVVILLVTLLLFIIVLLVLLNFAVPKVGAKMVGPTMLDKSTNLIPPSDSEFYLKAPQSTVQFFVYLSPMQRTATTHICGDEPGQPSCSNGRYPVCECVGTDCTECKHKGYYSLLNIFGAVMMEISSLPDASRQSQAAVQLVVRTQINLIPDTTPVLNSIIETLVLPPIPYQKWTMITISRDGRRFDIYYDNNLVVSHTMLNTVTTTAWDSRGPMAGDTNMLGQIGLFNITPTVSNSLTVSAAYTSQADTRGRPYLNAVDDGGSLFPKLSLGSAKLPSLPSFSICPSGSCTQTPTVRPAQPWQDWDSNYS